MTDETKTTADMTKQELVDFAESENLTIDKSAKVDEIRGAVDEQLAAREEVPSQDVAPIDAADPAAGPHITPPDPPEAPEAPKTVADNEYSVGQICENAELMLGEPRFLVEAALAHSAGDLSHLTIDQARTVVDEFKAHETEVA